jgi:hypothetical protein
MRSRRSPNMGPVRDLTIRSSRPHVVASATCFTLRLHVSAAPPRVGLTQALGGRKTFCSCVARKPDFLASVSAALRSGCRHVASSVKFVWRAHTSHALRWSASETVIGFGQVLAADTIASVTPGGKFAGARPAVPASVFGRCVGARCTSASTAT